MTEVKKTITVVDKSTKALAKANADLVKVMGDLNGLTETVATLANEIEFKSSELAAIEAKSSDEFRKSQAELNIQVLENEDKVLADLMRARGLASITTKDLKALEADLETAKNECDAATSAAVTAATSQLEAAHKLETVELESKQSVETASLKATIESLNSRVEFLTESNASLNDIITQERAARVSVAQAAQPPVINVPKA